MQHGQSEAVQGVRMGEGGVGKEGRGFYEQEKEAITRGRGPAAAEMGHLGQTGGEQQRREDASGG